MIKWLLNFLLIIAVLSSFVFITWHFFLPTPDEYNDPTTSVEESFPWEPNIFSSNSNFTRALNLLVMGILRHIALLPQRMRTVELISMVGYTFLVMFINSIRKTFLSQKKLGIHNYVEWGIGSIVGGIIYVVGTTSVRSIPDVAFAAVCFSIACVILYLIHPHVGLFHALKEKIQKKQAREKE